MNEYDKALVEAEAKLGRPLTDDERVIAEVFWRNGIISMRDKVIGASHNAPNYDSLIECAKNHGLVSMLNGAMRHG